MARPKKEAKYLNVYLDKQVYDDLSTFCEKSGQSKTLAVERAIQMYIGDMSKNKPKNEKE